MPEQIVVKLEMYIMSLKAISTALFINSLFSNTNIAASQIILVITLILLECPVIPTLKPLKLYCFTDFIRHA
jgi:hypothetical protein